MRKPIYILSVIMLTSLPFSAIFAQGQKAATHSEDQQEQQKVSGEVKVYSQKEVDIKAKILNQKELDPEKWGPCVDCPDGATVVLRVVLHKSGKVTGVKIKRPAQCSLDAKAVKTVLLIKFTPAVKDGIAVSQYTDVEYKFRKS
jgi:TonB family protein